VRMNDEDDDEAIRGSPASQNSAAAALRSTNSTYERISEGQLFENALVTRQGSNKMYYAY